MSARSEPQGERRPWTGTLALVALIWIILINQLRVSWATNPQYAYGWIVPVLVLALAWMRWPSRPEPAPLAHPGWWNLSAALLLVALLPTRLVGEANPEWSVAQWALALEVVALTLAVLGRIAGAATMLHFAFPVCFILVAVPWPVQAETALTQTLMQTLASVTAEIAAWSGIAAAPQGNLIALSTGVVGVDEACSGVRSLQSMLMGALFLGEMYRFSVGKRVSLVLAGLALALFFNLARAFILVQIAAGHGLAALDRWHDPAGFSILLFSMGALYAIAHALQTAPPSEEPDPPRRHWRALPVSMVATMAGAVALAEISTELWYRAHEHGLPNSPKWSVRWPESKPSFKQIRISPYVAKQLAYSEGGEAVWDDPNGSQWTVFAFRWNPGRTSTIAARQHRPEVCLPAGGRKLVEEAAPTVIEAGTLRIPFRTYEFVSQGGPLYVFFGLWENGHRDLAESGLSQDYSRRSRLARVTAGQRNLGQQSMEVIISGCATREAAVEAFRQQARELIQPVAG